MVLTPTKRYPILQPPDASPRTIRRAGQRYQQFAILWRRRIALRSLGVVHRWPIVREGE